MFGKPTQQPGTLFAAAAPTSSTGFSFGTPAGTTAAPGAFSFGGSINPNPASGFSSGSAGTLFTSTNPVSSTAPNTALGAGSSFTGFGTTPAINSVVRPTFSMPQTVQPSLGTGTTATGLFGGLTAGAPPTSGATGGFGFGAPALGTMAGGFGQGSLGSFGAPSLGLNTALTAQPITSLGIGSFGTGFGATTTMTPSLGSFLGSSSMALMPTSSLSGVQPAPFVGLGGTGTSQTPAGGAKNDSKTLKEYPVPPEMTSLAEDFKKYMKEQKNVREAISRYSSKPIAKVQEEVGSLRQGLSVTSNSIQRNTAAIRKLKQETAQESRHVDVMQRTKDMPLSLQYENTAPTEYFQRQVATFEVNMKTFRQQIDMLERHLASGSQSAFTSQELLSTIRRLYETFVYLASELQTVHENLDKQKERYVAYRRAFYGESSNMFESRPATKTSSLTVATTIGPSPFTNTHGTAILASAIEQAQRSTGATHLPPTAGLSSSGSTGGFNTSSFNLTSGLGTSGLQSRNFLGTSNVMPVKPLGGALSAPVGGGGCFGSGLGGGSSFASPAMTSSFGIANSTNFQLQRPPAGNKRGKR